MTTARQQGQAASRRSLVLRLGKYSPPDRNHCIPGKHVRAIAADRLRLFQRHAMSVGTRKFGFSRRFVDVRCRDRVGNEAEAAQ